MSQYRIEAKSNIKNLIVSNIPNVRVVNPGEEDVPAPVVDFPSPAEFTTKAEADAQATKFADWLNSEDHEGTWDWVGQATAV
jgi:hypothetical protein